MKSDCFFYQFSFISRRSEGGLLAQAFAAASQCVDRGSESGKTAPAKLRQ